MQVTCVAEFLSCILLVISVMFNVFLGPLCFIYVENTTKVLEKDTILITVNVDIRVDFILPQMFLYVS